VAKPEPEPAAEQPMEVAKKEPEPEVPQRPEDLSKWKKNDYLSAKKESDRKLEAAVLMMGEKFQGDARAAGLFKELLVVEHLPAQKMPNGTMGRPTELAVTTAVSNALIKSLVLNQTPESTAILKDLMYGKIESPMDDMRVVNVILSEIVQHLDYQEYEDFIFGLLTQPEKTLDGSVLAPEAPLTPDRLRALLLSLLSTTSSPRINVRLAKYLEDPEVTKALAADIEGMLIRDKPDTLTAKLILYQNPHAEKRTILSSENTMVAHSEIAVGYLLGLPSKLEEIPPAGTVSRPTARQPGLSAGEIAAEMAFAKECWTPELQTYLMQQIAKQPDPTALPGPLKLIGAIPTALARGNLNEIVTANAYRGPAPWNAAGMFGRSTTDPAFLIMAKNLYHNPARRGGRGAPDKETQDKWRDAMEPLVQGWIKRFYSAARNSIPEDWAAAKETGNFKITFHRGAQVVTEYHLLWPGTAQANLPEVPLAGLEVHYYRLEDRAVPEKIIGHYKRYGATGPNAPKRKEMTNGAWYDDLDHGADPKSKRSVDIYINHKAIPEEKAPPGVILEPKAVPISIDILTIEIPDPAEK
jgi:hypothetical protein